MLIAVVEFKHSHIKLYWTEREEVSGKSAVLQITLKSTHPVGKVGQYLRCVF